MGTALDLASRQRPVGSCVNITGSEAGSGGQMEEACRKQLKDYIPQVPGQGAGAFCSFPAWFPCI